MSTPLDKIPFQKASYQVNPIIHSNKTKLRIDLKHSIEKYVVVTIKALSKTESTS